jgi:hypothetical protein
MMKRKIILLDLPTYPKGVLSLSLLSIATCLKNDFAAEIIDLNIEDFNLDTIIASSCTLIGMKVSAQNSKIASTLTQLIKSSNRAIKVLWGGEFPTLLPEVCLLDADAIICGLFEPISAQFIHDVQNDSLQKIYTSDVNYAMEIVPAPDFYYWTREKYDPENKAYTKLYDDFSFVHSTSNNKSFIKWHNKSYPHIMSLCPDLIFVFEFMDKDSAIISKSTFRVKRKKEYDKMMCDQFEKNTLGGEKGVDIPNCEEEKLYHIEIIAHRTPKFLRIKIITKAQYWFPDSLHIHTFSKLKSLN